MPERVAILVVHGIGEERPYETLDQFTRNLMDSLNLHAPQADQWTIEPQLDSAPDPTRASNSWVRAFFRLTPAAPVAFRSDPTAQIQDITLYEYYWSPITKDKVAYTTSLTFLMKAGLQPFLYLAANIQAISQSATESKLAIATREIWRQCTLFIPLLLLFAWLLYWLSTTTGESLAELKHISPPLIITLVLLAIRYLSLTSAGNALLQSIRARSGWQTSNIWRAWLVFSILFNLFFWPYGLPFLLLHFGHVSGSIRQFLDSWRCLAPSDPLRRLPEPWLNALAFVLLRPSLLIYVKAAVALALAAWVRFILITYVGDVAVYANANELSKNFAARAQVLDGCSAALGSILLKRNAAGDGPAYDRVLIAAHSLGSVIAYDTMNQLLNQARLPAPPAGTPPGIRPANLVNLRGLLTFGSPLNKFFYFFRELDDPKGTLRHQTLDLLHGFRLKKTITDDVPEPHFTKTTDPDWIAANAALAKNFDWINAYAHLDPISGSLLFYDLGKATVAPAPAGFLDGSSQKCFPYRKPLAAHLEYWSDPHFYDFFRSNLL